MADVEEEPRSHRAMRQVLAAFYGGCTLLLLLIAPITGLLSLPFAMVTAGLSLGVSEQAPGQPAPEGARWLIGTGLILVAAEVVFFVIVAVVR